MHEDPAVSSHADVYRDTKKPVALYVQLMGASGAGKSVTMSQPWLWSRVGESRNWFNERAEDTDCTLMQDQYLNTVAPSMDVEEQQDSIRAHTP